MRVSCALHSIAILSILDNIVHILIMKKVMINLLFGDCLVNHINKNNEQDRLNNICTHISFLQK